MKITVAKNGENFGPFPVEEINARLLAGELKPDDWAWPEGATDWVRLGSVRGVGFSSPTKPPPRIRRKVVIWLVAITVLVLLLLNSVMKEQARLDDRMELQRIENEKFRRSLYRSDR